jgi:uncharacterized membrane protein
VQGEVTARRDGGTLTDPQDEINQREWEYPSNWTGWFGSYSSRSDTRLWVPKRPLTGSGQALNFGHPQAKWFVAAMLMIPAAMFVAIILAILVRAAR